MPAPIALLKAAKDRLPGRDPGRFRAAPRALLSWRSFAFLLASLGALPESLRAGEAAPAFAPASPAEVSPAHASGAIPSGLAESPAGPERTASDTAAAAVARRSSRTIPDAGPATMPAAVAAGPRPSRLVFVGDVLLARGVIRERNGRGRSPWRDWGPFFAGADWIMGNLEGAVGPMSGCSPVPGPCFAIPDSLLADARAAGFTAFSLANNHAADLGEEGYARTRTALLGRGLVPVGFGDSPVFRSVGGRIVAFVAMTLAPGKDGRAQALPGVEEARKLRFARAFAERVVVFVHWGGELRDWADSAQIEGARWLAGQGADLILGAHPHVIQPAACVAGVPVFYSLGNHLFDQKYPETRRGGIADCILDEAGFTCGSLATAAEPDGFFPRPPDRGPAAKAEPLLRCAGPARARGIGNVRIVTVFTRDSTSLEWMMPGAGGRPIRWSRSASGLLCAAPFRLRGDSGAYLFALERHYSDLDGENAPRPYVYFLGARGPVAKWRGSGLAWPLIDAAPLPAEPGVLCALHRGDSFLMPDPTAPAGRIAAYRWNGFGFNLAKDAGLDGACRAELGYPLR